MSALRECPGCGSFSMPYVSKRREGVWRAACDECGFAGPEDDTEAAAIAAWNRRATPAEVEALRVRVERLEADARLMALALAGHRARAALEDRNDD